MNDKRATLRERAQRFRRRMNGKDRAVSPVVATLILILIAVAAAAALYLWLVVWQGHITSGIGNVGAQPTLTIGGSTSAYPFDELAVTQFEQNNSDVTISNTQGGSTAGMLAVCNGAVNIGAASFPVTAATLVSTYGCSASVESTIQVQTVAYDAVDVIVPKANDHGLLSINFDTLALIYADATAATGAKPSLVPLTEDGGNVTSTGATTAASSNGALIPTGIPTPSEILAGSAGALEWGQIPAAVGGADLSGLSNNHGATPVAVAEELDPAATPVAAAGALCGVPAYADDICDAAVVSGAVADTAYSGTPCGFLVCAGGLAIGAGTGNSGAAISTYARSDASGTTQSFEARLLDAESSSTFATTSNLQSPTAGFSGCGSNNYISDCKYVATHTADGNPLVVAGVAADTDSIGYASDGIARSAGTVALIPFLGVGQTVNAAAYTSESPSWYGAILPTTGASGTIALGIKSSVANSPGSDYSTGYLGWRPFDLVTLAEPTGVAAEFLTFITNPQVNPALATQAQEVSIYSVGAVPGVT